MTFATDAEQIAVELTEAGVKAFADPVLAQTKRPCVLVAPPSHDYAARATTWRLVALASTEAPGLKAFRELSELVEQLDAVLPIEQADPASYPLAPPPAQPIPAYIVRFTT